MNTSGTEAESLVGDDLLDRLCGTQQADVDRSIAEWKKDREAYDVRRRKMEALPAVTEEEAIGLAGTYEHSAYTICRIESENGNLYFRYGVVRCQLHWDEQDILGIWKSDLVPEDYDVITLRFRDGDLLLNTGESTLWHCFKKQ